MIAFAGNSLLCRLALAHTNIDAASFTALRLVSGALMLCVLLAASGQTGLARQLRSHGSWVAAFALSGYAICFSFAYLEVTAATGALLLFTSVQATMLGYGYYRGDRLSAVQLTALLVALLGLLVLTFPGVSAPPVLGGLLMVLAGVAWGVYSLSAGGADPLATTAANFVRAVPLGLACMLAALPWVQVDPLGLVYAVASGAVTSGIGYALWYAALKDLNVTTAATVQLSVPVITALLAVVLLDEALGLRVVVASAAILGGVAVVIRSKQSA